MMPYVPAIAWITAYVLIAGMVFHDARTIDRERPTQLQAAGPLKCAVIAALWPLAFLLGMALKIYGRIVEGKRK